MNRRLLRLEVQLGQQLADRLAILEQLRPAVPLAARPRLAREPLVPGRPLGAQDVQAVVRGDA